MGMNFQPVTDFLDGVEARWGVPACECVVTVDHKPVYRHWAGHMGWGQASEPLRGGEWYWIYSCTKLMTMTAALQLWEQGKLGLDDPAAKYIPELGSLMVRDGGTLRPARSKLTIRHLMTMTGGFTYDQTLPAIRAAQAKNAGTVELIRALAAEPLAFDPGTHFCYSMCHDVMAAVIEIISGERFSDYIARHIVRPLGIEGVTFRPGERELARMPVQICWHDRRREFFLADKDNTHQLTADYDSGGAGICCRAEDYIPFVDALACGGVGTNGARILQPETVELMRTNQLTGQTLADYNNTMKPAPEGYALGVRVHLVDDRFPKGEFGWDGAAGALALMEPTRRLGVFYVQHVLNYLPNYSELHPALMERIYAAVDGR